MKFISRYCNQSLFNILFYEYPKYGSRDFKKINCKDFQSIKYFTSLPKEVDIYRSVFLKGNIYMFFVKELNIDQNNIKIIKYSIASKFWQDTVSLSYRKKFNACAFIDKIFVIGGRNESYCSSCIQYDTREGKFEQLKQVASMSEGRAHAGCAVYQGKIVVSGGKTHTGATNTVEVYDHAEDAWSYMPSMVYRRCRHNLVAVNDKLFVIGMKSPSCEVFDKSAEQFVMIKTLSNFSNFCYFDQPKAAISVGYKIALIGRAKSTVLIYDTQHKYWYEESNIFLDLLCYTTGVKIPQT